MPVSVSKRKATTRQRGRLGQSISYGGKHRAFQFLYDCLVSL